MASDWDAYIIPDEPGDLVRAEEVLSQRYFDRVPLNASVPMALEIGLRLGKLRVVSRIERIPPADLVALGLDWFLRGGGNDVADIAAPWNQYRGPGTPTEIPRAEDVLRQRFIAREQLKASVPEELQLPHRLAMYKVNNRGLRRVPVADIVAVAMDRWLRLMGF
ncbi:hypothetical protein [Streptomyces sp. NPDC001948]